MRGINELTRFFACLKKKKKVLWSRIHEAPLELNVSKWLNVKKFFLFDVLLFVKNLSPQTEVIFCHRSNTLLMPRLYQNTICCEHSGVVCLPDIHGGLLRPSESVICFSIWILAMSVATSHKRKKQDHTLCWNETLTYITNILIYHTSPNLCYRQAELRRFKKKKEH